MMLYMKMYKNHSTLMCICVYDQIAQAVNKGSSEFKLINDIRDAVSILTENKTKRSKPCKRPVTNTYKLLVTLTGQRSR